jgi:PadR family transcriptional regulator PadR
MEKSAVWQGTLALMVLKCLEGLGPQHGYGIARRIEQTSEDMLSINHGTLYPVLLKLEQEGSIASEWGTSENNRKAKFYRITKSGKKQLESEARQWQQTTDIIAGSSLSKRRRNEAAAPFVEAPDRHVHRISSRPRVV